MASITFVIPGEPKGKGRHRTFRSRGRNVFVTPKETASYENLVKLMFRSAAVKQEWEMVELGRPVFMVVSVSMERSKSMPAARMTACRGWATKTPDLDNIAKIICDALNGIAYHDDAQVVSIMISKRYVVGAPSVSVSLRTSDVG